MIWSDESPMHAEQTYLESCFSADKSVIVTNEHEKIIGVSEAWTVMCGFAAHDVFGMTPKVLQGADTDLTAARAFVSDIRNSQRAHVILVNYKKSKQTFRHELIGWQYGDLMIAESVSENAIEI